MPGFLPASAGVARAEDPANRMSDSVLGCGKRLAGSPCSAASSDNKEGRSISVLDWRLQCREWPSYS